MGLIDDCKEYFNTKDLYDVLSVCRNATEAELKNGYKKLSLKFHPDKVKAEEKEEATRKFQVLSQVYVILSDKDKRSLYDETGAVDDENFLSDQDWGTFWRLLFPKLTVKDIDNYLEKYKGSEEEKQDLKVNYVKYEGDFNLISECLVGYEFEDEPRYRDILNTMIKNKDIPEFPKFTKERKARQSAREKRLKRDMADPVKSPAATDPLQAIAQRSQARETQFNDMIKSLEAKYSNPKPSGKKKKK